MTTRHNQYGQNEPARIAAILDHNPQMVLLLGRDGSITYANTAALETARKTCTGDPVKLLPSDVKTIVEECRLAQQSKLREISINGRTVSWSFVPDSSNETVHCYGIDITERLNLEAQLRHAQKLESVGQLAAGVAHDFNNILTIIQGHSERLLSTSGEKADLAEPLRQISGAARRASELTRQLLMFSRKQVFQPQILDLNSILVNVSKLLHRVLGEDITLEIQCAEDLPCVEGDAGMIEQIIMNLAANARDAMPRGGRLSVTTSTVNIDSAYADQHPDSRSGQCVCLTISDTGSGMSRETLDHIFEPFFTTKEVGKGTGLGLATVYGLVRQQQGWLEVQSEVDWGTTFRIFFPSVERRDHLTAAQSVNSDRISGGNETILVVEDEPNLRELSKAVLNDYHYKVLVASNGAEALTVLQKHEGDIDLLFTDIVMPGGMNGRELADRLRVQKPHLKVLYTSGYGADLLDPHKTLGKSLFLQKPYPPPLLAKTVRLLLDS